MSSRTVVPSRFPFCALCLMLLCVLLALAPYAWAGVGGFRNSAVGGVSISADGIVGIPTVEAKSLYLKELRKIATIESIGASTRIEGARLTDQEVEKLLASVKITKFESRDQQEVIGYYDALQVILDN